MGRRTVVLFLITCVSTAGPGVVKGQNGGGPCSGLSGGAAGLCNAFCEAQNCDVDDSSRSCQVLRRNFQRQTGSSVFPCEVAVTPTDTPTVVPTNTATAVATATETQVATVSATSTVTLTPIFTATATTEATATETPEATATPTDEVPGTPTETTVPTQTFTPIFTATATTEATATETPEPPATDTPEPTATDTPEPTSTFTPIFTATGTTEATATETPEPPATDTPEATSTFTAIPTATATTEATSTDTPEPTATLVPTFTLTNTPESTSTPTSTEPPTSTPTNTTIPTATATSTPTETAIPAVQTCNFDGTAIDDNSSLQICFLGVCPAPNDISGAVNLTCDPASQDVNGKRDCGCELVTLDPFVLSGVGTICVSPAASACPTGEIDCDGGNALDVDLVAEHQAGACTSNAGCASTCGTYCAGIGKAVYTSGCELQCQGGTRADQACICDTAGAATCSGGIAGVNDCPGGSCEGKDNDLGTNQCHCTCVDESFGAAAPAGAMNCRVGVAIVVEAGEDGICDGNVIVRLPPQCAPFTSQNATGIVLNDNEGPGNLGPYTETGAGGTCTQFDAGDVSGYEMVSVLGFFDSTIGDLISRLQIDCQ